MTTFNQLAIETLDKLVGRDTFMQSLLNSIPTGGGAIIYGGRRGGKSSILNCLAEYHDKQDLEKKYKFHYVDAKRLTEININSLLTEAGLEEFPFKPTTPTVLLVDEFDSLVTGENRLRAIDLNNLRSLIGHNFKIVLATGIPLGTIEMDGSDLLSTLKHMHLPGVEFDSPESFFKAMSGDDFFQSADKDCLKILYAWAGMHPWLMQRAGIALEFSANIDVFRNSLYDEETTTLTWLNKLNKENKDLDSHLLRIYLRKTAPDADGILTLGKSSRFKRWTRCCLVHDRTGIFPLAVSIIILNNEHMLNFKQLQAYAYMEFHNKTADEASQDSLWRLACQQGIIKIGEDNRCIVIGGCDV